MKAAVTTKPGAPEVIELLEKSIPSAKKGWVLIKIKAFGLNRSEIFTRRGDSPNVQFPRVQGIECVGMVEKEALVQLCHEYTLIRVIRNFREDEGRPFKAVLQERALNRLKLL